MAIISNSYYASIIYNYTIGMNYLKSFKPFSFISAIAEMNIPGMKNQTLNKQEQSSRKKDQEQFDNSITYDSSEHFIMQLRATIKELEERENLAKRKIKIFENMSIQPHYLQATANNKIIDFEFQLGSDIFLDRIMLLCEQINQINKAVSQLLENATPKIESFFQHFQQQQKKIYQTMIIVSQTRGQIKAIKDRAQFKIKNIIYRKKLIQQKIRLLKDVKSKNEGAFVIVQNIQQAFYTQQSRVRLYKKILKLTELQKSRYVGIIKNKLISTSKNNKKIVEERMFEWLQGNLDEKQVQKLVFMIYYIEKEDIYLENGIAIDYSCYDKKQLKLAISKICEWRQFHYVKDPSSRSKINQFFNYLIHKLS